MKSFIRSTESIVREVLLDFPPTRDCDMKLTALVWSKYYKSPVVLENMDSREFLKKIYDNKLPHVVSIVRSRQKLQQLNPDLRGDKYKDRQERLQKDVKKDMINWKHDEYKQPGLF